MKIAIVTLTFNQLEQATRPYIESLYAHTPKEDFQLIVVDNASSDGTVQYLRELEQQHGNVTLILNKENLGYSKGNNQGLALVDKSTPFIGLFNNDILFTPNWLPNVLKEFERDPRIGLASARINHINKRKAKLTKDNYLERYGRLLSRYKESFTCNVWAFFCCVVIRRETFEKVGYLDERFTPAFFEDDDYCFRSLYAGYRNGYVNTAFIFHNHCATTGNMEGRKKLIERNRKYFYEKHYLGQYIYERMRDEHKPLRKVKAFFKRLAGRE